MMQTQQAELIVQGLSLTREQLQAVVSLVNSGIDMAFKATPTPLDDLIWGYMRGIMVRIEDHLVDLLAARMGSTPAGSLVGTYAQAVDHG